MNDRLIIDNWKDSKSIYDDVKAPRTDKHGGYIALDGRVVCQTLQCCHCQKHFPVRKDSGVVRGFCSRHMQVTCGKEACNTCYDWEQHCADIERAEAKRRIVDSYLIG